MDQSYWGGCVHNVEPNGSSLNRYGLYVFKSFWMGFGGVPIRTPSGVSSALPSCAPIGKTYGMWYGGGGSNLDGYRRGLEAYLYPSPLKL